MAVPPSDVLFEQRMFSRRSNWDMDSIALSKENDKDKDQQKTSEKEGVYE
jgi:hypothetical protein